MGSVMQEQVQQFLEFLTAEKGFSRNTREAYQNDLTQLLEYLQSSNQPRFNSGGWQDISRSALSEYTMSLRNRDYAPTTVARKVASVKSFFAFLAGRRG